jgi:hypothetical protein
LQQESPIRARFNPPGQAAMPGALTSRALRTGVRRLKARDVRVLSASLDLGSQIS